jgi:type I restriction enzyme S subunit
MKVNDSKDIHTSPNRKWPTIKVGQALNLINGRAFKSTEWKKTGIPIVRIQNLNNPDAPFNYFQGDLPSKVALDNGDLLFAWSGTPGTSFGAHIWRGGKAWLNQHIFKVEFDKSQFDKRFLQLAINQNLAEYIRVAHGAAGLAHITKGRFESSDLPLLPLSKQLRIVAEIERQFTRLEAGVASLRRAQANLRRYRAAVLKAACEGRLVPTEVELARTENRKTSIETGEALLIRILKERRQNWQGRGQYKEPSVPDTSRVGSLPDGWTWASLDQLLSLMRNGISTKPDAEFGLPILRISAVRALSVNLAETRYLNATASELPEYVLTEGDLLFTRYNGNPELVGVCGVVPPLTYALTHPDKLIRCKMVPSGANPNFVAIMSNVGESRNYLAKRVRTTAGQAGISGGDLKGLPIPLAPFAEQNRIVAEVERRLSVVEELEEQVTINLQRAARLRQSILQKAFTGELV